MGTTTSCSSFEVKTTRPTQHLAQERTTTFTNNQHVEPLKKARKKTQNRKKKTRQRPRDIRLQQFTNHVAQPIIQPSLPSLPFSPSVQTVVDPPKDQKDHKMIILACQGRSGSTYLRQCINVIPSVYLQGENSNFIIKLMTSYMALKETKNFPCRAMNICLPGGSRTIHSAWENSFDLEQIKLQLKAMIVNFLGRGNQTGSNNSLSTLGFKEIRIGKYENTYIEFEQGLLAFKELFPETRIIFHTRKDLDKCVASHVQCNGFKNELNVVKTYLLRQTTYFQQFAQRHPSWTYTSTYEDLVEKTDQFKKLFPFVSAYTYETLQSKLDEVASIKHQAS